MLFLFIQTLVTKHSLNNNNILLKRFVVILKSFIFAGSVVKLFEINFCPENNPVFDDICPFVITTVKIAFGISLTVNG